jgi:hypothetical protein
MKPSKKLCLDSDEEYYKRDDINQQLKTQSEKNIETDHSALKALSENDKM